MNVWSLQQMYVQCSCFRFVVDGGALLRAVQWCKGSCFGEIAKRYVDFVLRKYQNATVIFDGYNLPSTKDHERLRRCPFPLSRLVRITNEVKVPYTQEKYLTLGENKAELVKFLSANLREAGVMSNY